MIKIEQLYKQYNNRPVVSIDTLKIGAGGMTGLVGNNGAGKTTLFRLLLDLVKADKGRVLLGGFVVSDSEEWKSFTAAYLDEGFLIGYLTPTEYFYFTGSLHGMSPATVDEALLPMQPFFDRSVEPRRYIRDLSKGNQSKVGIVACLLKEPNLLILDEPFANLDPSSQVRLKKMLQEMQSRKAMTILISSHDLNHITDLCDRILLMEQGKIIRDINTGTHADTLRALETYFNV